jgi:tetratricopeptide (TPR) repeat protein
LAVAWKYRGLTLTKLQRYEEALATFDKAIQLEPIRDKLSSS